MSGFWYDVFSYGFLGRAFLVGCLVSLCSSLLGVILVLKRYSMIGDGLSHVSFGALSVAVALGFAPLKISIPVVILAAFFLLRIRNSKRIKSDAAIAVISSSSLAIGVTAPFYLSKLFAPYFAPGASILNISSSRDRMSQPQSESYTAAKGGISALTHAMAVSFAGKVRVNSISPGWIDTAYTVYEGPDAYQQPAGRVGNPMDIANMVLFLASDKAGFITGENICIDGGMTRQMIYHGDHGWTLNP